MTKVKLLTVGGYTKELKNLDFTKTFTAKPFDPDEDGVLGYEVDNDELRAAGAVIDPDYEALYFSITGQWGIECEVIDG